MSWLRPDQPRLQRDGVGVIVTVAAVAATFFGGRGQFKAVFQFNNREQIVCIGLRSRKRKLIFHGYLDLIKGEKLV